MSTRYASTAPASIITPLPRLLSPSLSLSATFFFVCTIVVPCLSSVDPIEPTTVDPHTTSIATVSLSPGTPTSGNGSSNTPTRSTDRDRDRPDSQRAKRQRLAPASDDRRRSGPSAPAPMPNMSPRRVPPPDVVASSPRIDPSMYGRPGTMLPLGKMRRPYDHLDLKKLPIVRHHTLRENASSPVKESDSKSAASTPGQRAATTTPDAAVSSGERRKSQSDASADGESDENGGGRSAASSRLASGAARDSDGDRVSFDHGFDDLDYDDEE
eukprot:m.8212 g.8212  ORF g.8212 m.8212 type:complete len:270 (-) comp2513_c0_seq2:568-1377(-)